MHAIAKFPLPTKLGEIHRIDGPDGAVAYVKRIVRGEYTLRREGVKDHCRFGDAAHIREDIAYFMEGGGLPRGSMW